MTCWERVFQRAATNARIDREVEELRKSLTSDRAMSGAALSVLLRGDVGLVQVETRVAVDGHDVEIKLTDGLWRVLNPADIGRLGNSKSVLQNDNRNAINHSLLALNPASSSSRNIFSEVVGSSDQRQEVSSLQARISRRS